MTLHFSVRRDLQNGVVQNVSILRKSTIELALTMPERKLKDDRLRRTSGIEGLRVKDMELIEWKHILRCFHCTDCSASEVQHLLFGLKFNI